MSMQEAGSEISLAERNIRNIFQVIGKVNDFLVINSPSSFL